MHRPMYAFRLPLTLGLATSLLSACNSSTPANRIVTSASPAIASARVSDGSQAVQLSSAGSFSLILPAGALTSLTSQLGPVNVTAQAGATSSLSTADQAAVTAGTTAGASVLSALQVDVAAAGSGTRGFRVKQAATGQVAFTLQAGATCASNSIVVRQIVGGKAATLLGSALADKANPRQLSGSATATFGDRHLVFFLLCLPASGLSPHALVTGHPFPRHSHSPGAPGPVVSLLEFKPPAAPFTQVIPGAVLTVTDTDFIGHVDDWFQADDIGATITDYHFDIKGATEENGGQAQSGSAMVAVTGQGSHKISFDEELFPVMSDEENVLVLTDKTSGLVLTLIADQELQNVTIMAGNQLAVKRARHLTTQQVTNTTAKVTIASNPDGTWLIDGKGAATAQAAAQLVLQSPIGSGASLHGLVALLGLLTNQANLLAEPTLAPTNCNFNNKNVDQYVPALPVPGVSAHGDLTIKALPAAVSNLTQLLKAIILLMEQNLKK